MNVHQFSVLSARSRSLLSLLPLVLLLFLAGPLLVGCGEDEPGTEGEVGEVLEGGEESDGEVGESDEADSTAEEIAAAAEEAEELANEEGRYLIRLNPYAGEKYSYRVVRDQKVTAGEYTTRQKQTFDVDMAIESRNDDGSSVLGITYRRVRAEFTAPSPVVDSAGYTMVDTTGQIVLRNKTVKFDTKGKATVPGAERFKAFVGRKVLVTIDRRGNVRDVANVDPILTATLKSLKVSADTVNPKMLEAAKQGVRLEYGMLASLVFFSLAPDTAVSEGSKWSRSDSLPVAGMPSLTTYAYTVKSFDEKDERTVGTISGRLTTNPALPKQPIDNEMLSMKITKLALSGNATIKLDMASGFPVSRTSTITSTMGGVGTMKQGPDKGKSSGITMKESTTTTITRTGFKGVDGGAG